MKVVPKVLEFEWDKGNLDKSWKKHGIAAEEAESVFLDDGAVVLPDERHSLVEKRFVVIGESNATRYLFIPFTLRKNKVRIITVRRMHKKEVEKYEKNKKTI